MSHAIKKIVLFPVAFIFWVPFSFYSSRKNSKTNLLNVFFHFRSHPSSHGSILSHSLFAACTNWHLCSNQISEISKLARTAPCCKCTYSSIRILLVLGGLLRPDPSHVLI
jgi:hypothetical protein